MIHSYSVGDQVDLAKPLPKTPRGPYRITLLMPEGRDGEPQYSIRPAGDGPERVVSEAEILSVHQVVDDEDDAADDAPAPMSKAARQAAKSEREADARSAWNDYIDERDAVARRTAELRAMRLAAEAEAAAKILSVAKSAARKKAASTKAAKAEPAAKKAAASKTGKPAKTDQTSHI